MITDRDLRDQVATTLCDRVDEFDVRAIADEIQRRYGLVDVDQVPSEEYWGIVSEHGK